MNVINSITRLPRGVFAIEVSFVALFMSGVLVFTSDMVVKQSVQGMLDRLSYSAVSVLKERTQLYDKDQAIDADHYSQVEQLNKIVQSSLKRTLPKYQPKRFSSVYEQLTFTGSVQNPTMKLLSRAQGNQQHPCQSGSNLKSRAKAKLLSPVTNEQRRAPLFQVTLCYRTENWFGNLVGENFTLIRSNSIILGR